MLRGGTHVSSSWEQKLCVNLTHSRNDQEVEGRVRGKEGVGVTIFRTLSCIA